MNELLRELGPRALAVLVRRDGDVAAAEDAVQEAMIEAVRRWPEAQPDDPLAWLIRVAERKRIDAHRATAARVAREERVHREPARGSTEQADDTLLLLSRCCHADLSPASAIALTLRAVGGLTTAQIARAFMVPEPTMAQRIARAKRTIRASRFDRPGDVRAVLAVLYLIFNEGFSGEIDLAEEAIRLTRQLHAASDDAEVAGLLALELLHHARQPARRSPAGTLIPLADQNRSLWDTDGIAEGVEILQQALARDQLGSYQAQAAIAALHDDAPSHDQTDWPQILEWYDELSALAPGAVVALNRCVALGHVEGPDAGLRALSAVPVTTPRWEATAAYLHELAGDHAEAARRYAAAAEASPHGPERDHLRLRAAELSTQPDTTA